MKNCILKGSEVDFALIITTPIKTDMHLYMHTFYIARSFTTAGTGFSHLCFMCVLSKLRMLWLCGSAPYSHSFSLSQWVEGENKKTKKLEFELR